MYKKISEIKDIYPNEYSVAFMNNSIVSLKKIGAMKNELEVIDKDGVVIKKKSLSQCGSYLIPINEQKLLLVYDSNKSQLLDYTSLNNVKLEVLEDFKVAWWFNFKNLIGIYQEDNSKVSAYGVFDTIKDEVLFITDGFNPNQIVNGQMFGFLEKRILTHYNSITGEEKWRFDLHKLGVFELENYKGEKEYKNYERRQLIGIWNNQVLLNLFPAKMISIDSLSGRFLWELDYVNDLNLGVLVNHWKPPTLLLDEKRNSILIVGGHYLSALNLLTKTISFKEVFHDLVSSEKQNFIFGNRGLISNTKFYFVGKEKGFNNSYLGVFDLIEKKIIWKEKVADALKGTPRIHGNYLGILDSKQTFHVFEKMTGRW